jgi:hypothetical protein
VEQDCCAVEGALSLEELKAHFIAARAGFRIAASRTPARPVKADVANKQRASKSSAAAAAAGSASAPAEVQMQRHAAAAAEVQRAAATEAGSSGVALCGRSLAARGAGGSGAADQRQQQQGGGVSNAAAAAAAADAAAAAGAPQRCDTLGQLTALLRKKHAANLAQVSNILTRGGFWPGSCTGRAES